jgi:hypothetical protein
VPGVRRGGDRRLKAQGSRLRQGGSGLRHGGTGRRPQTDLPDDGVHRRGGFGVAAAAVALFSWGGDPGALQVAQAIIVGVLGVAFLRRYGLLAFAVTITAWRAVGITPWTFDLTKWIAARQGLTIVFLMGLALWGFKNVLGKQSALPAGALDG